MESEFINVPGKGLCILISNFRSVSKSEIQLSPSQVPTINILFTDVDSIATEIRNGKKIAAIKLIREQTGWGLKESKDYIDKYMIVYGDIRRQSETSNNHNENMAVKFINDHTMEDFLDREEMQL